MYEENPWRVVRVASNQEKKVARSLAARSIEHYLPLYKERRQWADRTMVGSYPLFPGYLFLRFSPQERVDVLSTPGVVRMLGEERRDMVPASDVERIRIGLADGLSLRPHPWIVVGERVRIRRGTFASVEGVVRELRHQSSVVLSLGSMNHCFSLEIEACDLEVLKAHPRLSAS
jgi:transcription antitermination factor NusG